MMSLPLAVNLSTWWRPTSATHTLPLRSTVIMWGIQNSPAPQRRSTLPASNDKCEEEEHERRDEGLSDGTG
jgi:hypothetical protein